ncbi:hypothetical protein [Bacillus thuringiensis]|uniref:hypothetical protein n=1 Tax=Bacillus thuringiensis TaxID=1428 RepID=UPI001C4F7D28|nr:hypothetical protein [Bacillus thuringiensis]
MSKRYLVGMDGEKRKKKTKNLIEFIYPATVHECRGWISGNCPGANGKKCWFFI